MAFKNAEIRSQVRALLLTGEKTKAIMTEVGDGCLVSDVYGMKFDLTQKGELKRTEKKFATDAPGKVRKHKNPGKRATTPDVDFDRAAESELDRLQEQSGHYERLMTAYTGEKNDFVDVVEKKLASVTEKIKLLEAIRRAG